MQKHFINLGKSIVDVVESITINLKLSEIFDTSFWQELLITLLVILMNFIILPLLKKAYEKLILWLKKKQLLKEGDEEIISTYLKENNITLKEITKEDIEKIIKEIKNGRKQ